MSSTELYRPEETGPEKAPNLDSASLLGRYEAMVLGQDLSWDTRCEGLRTVGQGGQGVVLLGQRSGADGFALPLALKVFSPESYRDAQAYHEDMIRVASVASRVALIQHDNLPSVHDFVSHEGIRVLVMEWVDGYDLRQVLTAEMYERSQERLAPEHWQYVNDVIFTQGPSQPRLKPGVAVQILRDCLAALAALHREGIVHGDLKPANVMLKRTGTAKVIDLGSAMDLRTAEGRRMWSPAYAAPEVLEGGEVTVRSDLASLGYVLDEMLAGRPPFEGVNSIGELREAKRTLEERSGQILPKDVTSNDLLLYLCRRLVAAEPSRRFADAQAANLGRRGAAAFHRQLVKSDLASEYANDLRVWLEGLVDSNG